MFFIYQILLVLIFLISPIIILFRIIKKKEHRTRFLEKFTIFSKKRKPGNLIWFEDNERALLAQWADTIKKRSPKN